MSSETCEIRNLLISKGTEEDPVEIKERDVIISRLTAGRIRLLGQSNLSSSRPVAILARRRGTLTFSHCADRVGSGSGRGAYLFFWTRVITRSSRMCRDPGRPINRRPHESRTPRCVYGIEMNGHVGEGCAQGSPGCVESETQGLAACGRA